MLLVHKNAKTVKRIAKEIAVEENDVPMKDFSEALRYTEQLKSYC